MVILSAQMKPHLYVTHEETEYGPFGSRFSHEDDREHIGYLHDPDNYTHPALVLQEGPAENWCASILEEIPDALWWARGMKEVFHTYVYYNTLDFRNTAFEFRNMDSMCKGENSEIATLANQEGLTWAEDYKEFIPFKTPQPSGYRGVYGEFHPWLDRGVDVLHVYDTFSPTHVLELEWWG